MDCVVCKNSRSGICSPCRQKIELQLRLGKLPENLASGRRVGEGGVKLMRAFNKVWLEMPKPWPRLSETLKGEVHPLFCQACGCGADWDLIRWREYGLDEKPEMILLCSATLAAKS